MLTEPDWFLGNDRYLEEIRGKVRIPILRKDFTVDSYQIYEAKLLGADAVLLICALLDPKTLKEYIRIARELDFPPLQRLIPRRKFTKPWKRERELSESITGI